MHDIAEKYDNLGNRGNGYFGSVYKAYNKVVGRIEAVKIIENVSRLGPKGTVEAKVQHKVQHRNVVEIYDAFVRNDKLYILMEFLENGAVSELMKDGRKLSIKQAIRIAIDALHGLQFIHNNNFIHRDIKPNNLLLDDSKVSKLSDFGLTSELDEDGKYQSSFGYSFHKAPEVFTLGEYTREADIYSLGLTLYRMVNGDGFLSSINRGKLSYEIVTGKFPPRDIYSPDVPKKLKAIINKALSVDPSSRYPNAHTMRSELGKVSIPIDWSPVTITGRKQVWVGVDLDFKYQIIASKNIIGSTYNIVVKKGRDRLMRITKYSVERLTEKEMKKHLHKLLTESL
ncbi:serine/threonine-protein kinase PrkC [Peptococcaceae bacterium CEB3]|nr:serine/threonine-protein kinase PrkC [Peptococcaceae bacterium CEB3]